MSKLIREVKVNSSADNVWELVAVLGELDMWSPSLPCGDDDPCRFNCVEIGRKSGPFNGDTASRIVEWETGTVIGYDIQGVTGVKSLRNNITVESLGDDTKVVSTVRFELDGSGTDVHDVRKNFDLYMLESLNCLKHYAESREMEKELVC
jgi:hypothetical protein